MLRLAVGRRRTRARSATATSARSARANLFSGQHLDKRIGKPADRRHHLAADFVLLGDQTVGALDMYGRGSRDWPEDDLTAGMVMAGLATAYLINASQLHKERQLNKQLQGALDSRVIIEQAKAVLAGTESISPDEAFLRIRQHTRNGQGKIQDAAYAIVHHGLRV